MSISWLFWWIYQLKLEELTCLFLVCTFLFLWLHRKYQDHRWWRGFLCVFLVIWTGAALWGTILNRSCGTGEAWIRPLLYSYRECMETGNLEILRSNFMNALLFYPAGLLLAAILPNRWGQGRTVLAVLTVFALFSLSIELVQYWRLLGYSEIDDILHNTLGAATGCITLSLGSMPFPAKKDHPCV